MRVFITGLTGTLGTAIARLHHSRGHQVWGCARNETQAVSWLKDNYRLGTLFIGSADNLCDPRTDMGRLLPTMDKVYHCAAMKHVDLCEQSPVEAMMQNAALTCEVSTACLEHGVPLVFASSDKACLPQSVYGASKLVAERMVVSTSGVAVRLVNLIGSSGSVFSKWHEATMEGLPITLTDPEMTRYFMTVEEAADFMTAPHEEGYVSLPLTARSVRMGDVAHTLTRHSGGIEITQPRKGETLHQWLIAPGDCIRYTSNSIVLDNSGTILREGMCSSDSGLRWDINELLQAAGIR